MRSIFTVLLVLASYLPSCTLGQDFLTCRTTATTTNSAQISGQNRNRPDLTATTSSDAPLTFLSAKFLKASSGAGVVLSTQESRSGVFGPLQGQRTARDVLHGLSGDDSMALFGFIPRVIVEESAMPNAFARAPDQIVLTSSLIENLRSEDELGFVLAHELAHLFMHHSVGGGVASELEADEMALVLVAQGGLDSCASGPALRHIASLNTGFFSSVADRLAAIKKATSVKCL